MAKVLPRRDGEPGTRFHVMEAPDGKVEQLTVSRLADARVGRGLEHALAAHDAAGMTKAQRTADAHDPRPVDLLFHAHREPHCLAVGVEAGRGRPLLGGNPETA